ncbi:MAG: hypothetical protein M3P23_06195 [Actinomycetota bacterium]|nr:hypothetical protein [Actinomycetota bacterium]
MSFLDRLRRRVKTVTRPRVPLPERTGPRVRQVESGHEGALREQLSADPNDAAAFAELAEIVRRHAAEGHGPGAPSVTTPEARATGADDAVWALAEELAHSPRAWFPLVELARLSVIEDVDGAVRRLSIATDRDPTGQALLEGLIVLREAGLNDAALALGTGHWRPAEHNPEVGREMVLAAIAAGRIGDAKRHRAALMSHPDTARVSAIAADLEKQISKAKPSKSYS